MLDVTIFQKEVGEWSRRNFGENAVQPAHRPLLGVVEECGEFVEAVSERIKTDMIDAAGDIMVYMADYCERRGFDLGKIIASRKAVIGGLDRYADLSLLMKYVGKLCHSHLKNEQQIRMHENHDDRVKFAIAEILCVVDTMLRRDNLELDVATKLTWDRVSKRDWKANPATGV